MGNGTHQNYYATAWCISIDKYLVLCVHNQHYLFVIFRYREWRKLGASLCVTPRDETGRSARVGVLQHNENAAILWMTAGVTLIV